MYLHGRGVEQGFEKAAEWFTKAADQGHAWAQHRLGWMFLKNLIIDKNRRKAKYYLALAVWERKSAMRHLKQCFK